MEIDVVYESQDLIAINKPHGLLVHRSRIATDATEFALQKVRNYVGSRVYPVHRLDRKNSGTLLFAKSKEVNQDIQKLFREHKVKKKYLAIVRGFTPEEGIVDYALSNEGEAKESITHYKTQRFYEIDLPFNGFQTSRYSLVECQPQTGRFHQLRKHFAHIMHPILGDRPHGCNKQNKLWKDEFGLEHMMLHATSLELTYKDQVINIESDLSDSISQVIDVLDRRGV